MKFKAVIFDMDGVLIDSEFHWLKAEIGFLAKYGITPSRELSTTMIGRSLRESVTILKEKFNLSQSVAELLGEKRKYSNAIYEYQAQVMPGAAALISRVKQAGLKTAIASGASLERVRTIIARFGWKEYFNELVSSDQVGHQGKPNPAIYRYAVDRLGLTAGQCVAIEDSVNGLRAARGAGVACIAVPDPRWSWGDFSEADIIAASLEDKKLWSFIGL